MLKQKLSAPLIILLIFLSFGLHQFIYRLLDRYSNSFTIKQIVINGTTLSKDLSFENILTSATNSVNGDLNKLNIQELKYRLEALELIKNVVVNRDLPHTLKIDVTEREPVALLRYRNTNYTIDKEGIVLSLIPNIAIPTLNIEYGIAMNGNQVADEFLLEVLPPLASVNAKNIQSIRIDKNRKIFFKLYNVEPSFMLDNNLINDEFISKAQKIGQALTNKDVKLPTTIDIYSYKDRAIGSY